MDGEPRARLEAVGLLRSILLDRTTFIVTTCGAALVGRGEGFKVYWGRELSERCGGGGRYSNGNIFLRIEVLVRAALVRDGWGGILSLGHDLIGRYLGICFHVNGDEAQRSPRGTCAYTLV